MKDIENVFITIFLVIGIALVGMLSVDTYRCYKTKRVTVSELKTNGYSVDMTWFIAGSNVYQISRDGNTFIVGQNMISEYTK